MKQLNEMQTLFFPAEKIYYQPINKYLVEGYPFSNSNKESYDTFNREFFFRTYKEVTVAAIYWTKKLFGANSIRDLYVQNLEFGKKKQWFNAQIVHTGDGVIIDGEKFNPFVNISYSYNAVTKIKFEIGFYRYACSNGLIKGFKELSKMEIKPEHIFNIPFWINPCLVKFLTQRFENQVKVLKNTQLRGESIQAWTQRNVPRWNISRELIGRYQHEMGNTAWGLLNILTDAASNYEGEIGHTEVVQELEKFIDDRRANSERATRQRRIGAFLETLIQLIEQENKTDRAEIDINSPEFTITDENLRLLDDNNIREVYRLDVGKITF
jgi:hypothetical protein